MSPLDDLDRKVWLGDTHESAFDSLRNAFDTAAVLRNSGLDFVVAPIPDTGGQTVCRIGPRHTIAVFPFVEGRVSPFGRHEPRDRAAVVTLLAKLHRATPKVRGTTRSLGLTVYGRRRIDTALREMKQPWVGGPFSEPARQSLTAHAANVTALLAMADRIAAEVKSRARPWVVTHGEPHAANVVRTPDRPMLIDWDAVALALPERDLWMLVDDSGSEAAACAEATGCQLDADAWRYFRLAWDLNDLAEYLNVLRSPHGRSEDTVQAYEGLRACVAVSDR